MAAFPRIGVLGAGIAGLTAAHAFAEAGFPVTVHERAPAVGAAARTTPAA